MVVDVGQGLGSLTKLHSELQSQRGGDALELYVKSCPQLSAILFSASQPRLDVASDPILFHFLMALFF